MFHVYLNKFEIVVSHLFLVIFINNKGALAWYGKFKMGVWPRLDFDYIILFKCLGYNCNIYGAFELLCNSIANL